MRWNVLSISKLQRLHSWGLGTDKSFHPIFYDGCNYLFILGLILNHARKSCSWSVAIIPGVLGVAAVVVSSASVVGFTVVVSEINHWHYKSFQRNMNVYSHFNFFRLLKLTPQDNKTGMINSMLDDGLVMNGDGMQGCNCQEILRVSYTILSVKILITMRRKWIGNNMPIKMWNEIT